MKKSALLLLFVFSTLAALAQIEPIVVNAENIITKQYFSVKDGLAARDVFVYSGYFWQYLHRR
jgi:hypothetical protein